MEPLYFWQLFPDGPTFYVAFPPPRDVISFTEAICPTLAGLEDLIWVMFPHGHLCRGD